MLVHLAATFSLVLISATALNVQAVASETSAAGSRREAVPVDYLPFAQNVGRVFLEVPATAGGGGVDSVQVCSALAISTRLIITARHCFFDITGGKIPYTAAYVQIGYTAAKTGETHKLNPVFIDESEQEDFVVVETESVILGFSSSQMRAAESLPSGGKSLFILHHPDRVSTMALTRMQCAAFKTPIDGVFLRHTCDTSPGSSGAPIFDGNFRLVGIHRAGGRTAEDESFNQAVTFQALMEQSQVIQNAVKAWGGAVGSLAASINTQVEYKAEAHNIYFYKSDDKWFFRTGTDGVVFNLVEQSDVAGMVELWRPFDDKVFKFPAAGGSGVVKPKPISPWTDFGLFKKIK
ncbi:trypsin-like serine peptidase [Azospirillum brasilense]|uniref:Serine protease n=1 Tax=Azospirillum brasilense TaxID=192 RepID=A0A235H546_AZOBR|nr:serine protease [Azospirillum brasilense]OYD80921.1 hypothetical protein CHT98_28390 [Azospirillum brasilense]